MALTPFAPHAPGLYASEFYSTAPCWDDLQGPIGLAGGVASLALESVAAAGYQLRCFRHDQDDVLFLSYQLPHGWKRNSEVRPHIHVIPLADPATPQVVRFAGEYVWACTGFALPLTGWTAFEALHTVSPGDVNITRSVNLFAETPTASEVDQVKESSVLLLKVARTGTNVADTYSTNKVGGTVAANLAILSIDAHIQLEKRGTPSYIPPAY